MLVLADLHEARDAGVLSEQEAFALEALAESEEERVPDALFDAVERLYLWFCAADNNIH